MVHEFCSLLLPLTSIVVAYKPQILRHLQRYVMIILVYNFLTELQLPYPLHVFLGFTFLLNLLIQILLHFDSNT
ncbi:uncharacterized protein C8R40DRAFT_1083941 [Lentinula edodes]|uniref:uncharacterized protein n=1 Tax=Lentinula edodes TaxID=5353 RepID=UPI001E8D548C|nr:uncharacterized protein C8R40DRAFT_1083941 [Lentinula edodes]KAH7880003.1 hypothetical protein C8R40DRAFT_1083941 [Lentinula edodes]